MPPSRPLVVALVIAGWCTAAGPSPLAEETSTIAGTVSDAAGEPIPEARVRLTDTRGGPRETTADAAGLFRFAALRGAGLYTLTAEKEGFRSVTYEGLRPETGRTRRLNIRLKRPGERDAVVLVSRDPYPFQDLLRSLLQDLAIPVRTIDLDQSPDPESAVRQVRAERPNLILGTGLLAARLVRREISDIPVILTLLSDPRHHDLEADNICFVATHPEPGELLRRIRMLLPGAWRLGLVYDARASSLVARDMARLARRAGFETLTRPCYAPEDLEKSLKVLEGRIDVLAVPSDPLTMAVPALDLVTRWALQNRVPLAAPGPEWVRRGALFSYGATPETIGRDLSFLATQILTTGRQPSEIRLRAPSVSFLAINESTAVALGVRIPPELNPDITY